MDMAVLNPVNRDLFNQLIISSKLALMDELPQEVEIPLEDAYGQNAGNCVMVNVEVDEDMRREYLDEYIDELDTFGNDLIGHSLADIFKTCVNKQEEETLKAADSLTPDVQRLYTVIWNRAFDKTMDAVKDDIIYDATKNFEGSKELYNRAYDEYYQQRNSDGYTNADIDYMDYEP